jgi:signal transduction histidine kinase
MAIGVHDLTPLLQVFDMRTSIRFYCDLLGFELINQSQPGDGRLPARTETAAYFVAAEAMANAAKHSAASGVRVSATRVDDQLHLEVRDDGSGGADGNGSGIRGLADRIAAVGGTFAVDSPQGAGTLVRVSIPCGS